MKTFIWIIVAIAVGGYFVNSFMSERAERKAEEAEFARFELETKAALAQMVARTGAIDGWQDSLIKGKRSRLQPILTIELEKLWLEDRPILFVGHVVDVSIYDQSQYMVWVEKGVFSDLVLFWDTPLRLALTINKDLFDSFLEKHPEIFRKFGHQRYGSYNVAIVAYIHEIEVTHSIDEEGRREVLRIGHGNLVDILYTGNVRF